MIQKNLNVLLSNKSYKTLQMLYVLSVCYLEFIHCSCGERIYYGTDRNFDGTVPKSESYFINSTSPQTLCNCALKCFQSVVFCIGFLFSSQNASCKLLKTYLTDANKNGNFVGEDWEYRKRPTEILSLNKPVTASSNFEDYYPNAGHKLIYLVDGIKNAPGKFHTYYEPYPWVTIDLEKYSIIRDVVMYNRADNHGRWLHSVEIRVGNSSVWSEMTTCGTYPGPSETGDIIVVECRPSRYGRYVTLKIVQLNYITDDSNAKNGNNALVLEEVVINGLYL
ncbi:uncharacterized protein LOC128158303 [Crassostrea angulata]|uniref:uncharacterized protein LOC128158303 n=1 Tax=Magallana angulata TaxID=2784310 RepID=UPI0022B12D03|nr:uncharacterized protein LOC128158303 [Crassostrea angulata]